MKTFIVYDLDSKMPVAVGEQVSAETARYCASAATGIFHTNLLAEEIDLEKNYLLNETENFDYTEFTFNVTGTGASTDLSFQFTILARSGS
jgi:hypothetical protein